MRLRYGTMDADGKAQGGDAGAERRDGMDRFSQAINAMLDEAGIGSNIRIVEDAEGKPRCVEIEEMSPRYENGNGYPTVKLMASDDDEAEELDLRRFELGAPDGARSEKLEKAAAAINEAVGELLKVEADAQRQAEEEMETHEREIAKARTQGQQAIDAEMRKSSDEWEDILIHADICAGRATSKLIRAINEEIRAE